MDNFKNNDYKNYKIVIIKNNKQTIVNKNTGKRLRFENGEEIDTFDFIYGNYASNNLVPDSPYCICKNNGEFLLLNLETGKQQPLPKVNDVYCAHPIYWILKSVTENGEHFNHAIFNIRRGKYITNYNRKIIHAPILYNINKSFGLPLLKPARVFNLYISINYLYIQSSLFHLLKINSANSINVWENYYKCF